MARPQKVACVLYGRNVWLMSDRAGTMFVKRNDWHTLSHTSQVGVVRCCPLPARPYVLLIIVRVLFRMPSWYPCFCTPPSSSCSSYCSLRCSSCCSSFSHRRPSAAKYREGRPKCNWHLNIMTICQTIGATIGGSSPKQNTLCAVVVGQNVLNWQSTWHHNSIRRKQKNVMSSAENDQCNQWWLVDPEFG